LGIWRYSPEGKLKWQHTYVDQEYYANYSLFYDIEEAENGDIVLFGGLKTDSIGEWYNTQYSWLLRVDSNGCYTPGCELADTLTKVLTDIEDLTTTGLAKRVEIYPNPATDYITVRLPEGAAWSKWQMYDIEGRKVMKGDVDIRNQNKASQVSFEIALRLQTSKSKIKNGLYFLMLKGEDGKIAIGKFVVE